MLKIILLLLIVATLSVGCSSNYIYTPHNDSENTKAENHSITNPSGTTLETRISTPDGYKRVTAEDNTLIQFLRTYQMKEYSSPLLLYNSTAKSNQNAHAAIFSLPIENADLQQCADSVMRVFAEYYRSTGQDDKIAFHFTDGFLCEYSKWKEGYRVFFNSGKPSFKKSSSYNDSYESFTKYMRIVFSYAGTASMESLEAETISLSQLNVGDVILKGGSPGHVVMVVDMCENSDGKKAFLLAQGYMPAQEFHVIKNPLHANDPWYYEEEITFPLRTPEYIFEDASMLKRLTY